MRSRASTWWCGCGARTADRRQHDWTSSSRRPAVSAGFLFSCSAHACMRAPGPACLLGYFPSGPRLTLRLAATMICQHQDREDFVMATALKRVKIAPKGMGLNDFVAHQEGFFAAEGLDVEFDWKTFRGTQSSWKDLDYFHRPQDRPYTDDKQDVIQGACVWGSICNASAGMGRFVPDAYGLSPWAIFVRPQSRIQRPEDLKDVPISVGMRAGSHFNVPYRLEKFLPLEHIKTVNTGGFGARLKALLDGEVEAASLLPPQIAMAEQLGLRKIIADTFHTLWWVPENSEPDVVRGYLRALDRAEQAMDADLAKYLPLWRLAVPAEFETYRAWDFATFGRGERFVHQPIPREEFDATLEQVKRWGLDQYLQDRSFERLSFTVGQAG